MNAQKNFTESAPTLTETVNSCHKKKSENESFVANLKDHIHELIHTPMEEHKACIKTTFQKFIGKFSERAPAPKEGENSVPLRTPVKN